MELKDNPKYTSGIAEFLLDTVQPASTRGIRQKRSKRQSSSSAWTLSNDDALLGEDTDNLIHYIRSANASRSHDSQAEKVQLPFAKILQSSTDPRAEAIQDGLGRSLMQDSFLLRELTDGQPLTVSCFHIAEGLGLGDSPKACTVRRQPWQTFTFEFSSLCDCEVTNDATGQHRRSGSLPNFNGQILQICVSPAGRGPIR